MAVAFWASRATEAPVPQTRALRSRGHRQLTPGGPGAGEAVGGTDVSIDDLECARCYSPAVIWGCQSKVVTANVSIKDGTPADLSPPSGCGA